MNKFASATAVALVVAAPGWALAQQAGVTTEGRQGAAGQAGITTLPQAGGWGYGTATVPGFSQFGVPLALSEQAQPPAAARRAPTAGGQVAVIPRGGAPVGQPQPGFGQPSPPQPGFGQPFPPQAGYGPPGFPPQAGYGPPGFAPPPGAFGPQAYGPPPAYGAPPGVYVVPGTQPPFTPPPGFAQRGFQQQDQQVRQQDQQARQQQEQQARQQQEQQARQQQQQRQPQQQAVQQQGQQQPGPFGQAQVIPLAQWDYGTLYQQGWRAEQLLDADVYGPNGEEIGEVENILIGPQGQIVSIIAEVGGFWDIGDTHVNIPWNQIQITAGFDRVIVPVTEENVEQYSLYGQDAMLTLTGARAITAVEDDLTTGPRVWKVTNLIDDYVTLAGGTGYGYVEDVIFQGGRVAAVLVNADVAYGAGGPRAYPFYGYGYGFEPGLDYYTLPYGPQEVAEVQPFDVGQLD